MLKGPTTFRVGYIANPIPEIFSNIQLIHRSITLEYPTRLEAMALDTRMIAPKADRKYTAGQINFSVNLFKTVTIKVNRRTNSLNISTSSPRPSLIKHAVMIMRGILNIQDGLDIDVKSDFEFRHCGLGSSSSLIAVVSTAINEIYGNPIQADILIKYLAQNHGEEIDANQDSLVPVQCLGGSAACGLYEGSLIIIAGESVVIKSKIISEEYKVVIGIPKDYQSLDSEKQMKSELGNMEKFEKTGQEYAEKIAYRLVHECLPAIQNGDLKVIGDLIFDYRFKMGSIKNCSFLYSQLSLLADKIAFLKTDNHADVVSISSVGPLFFAITREPDFCEQVFRENDMITYRCELYNHKYKILHLE